MPQPAVVQQLDGPLTAPLPPVLDEEPEHRTELLPAQRILTPHRREIDDHELRLRRDRKAGKPRDRLRRLTDDVGIDSAPGARDHDALEGALLLGRTEVRPFPAKRVTHETLDRRIADGG